MGIVVFTFKIVNANQIHQMNQEKFNLTWHTYTDHLRQMLHDMMNSHEMTDVTLVSEDKKQFKAHKVVLSAASSIFKSIISENTLSNPIIYLRGIQSHEIESILEFIYLGQATFFQDRMNEFLDVAKSLEIKEISKDVETPENLHIYDEEQVSDQTEEIVTTENEPVIIKENSVHKQRQIRSNHENKFPCEQCNYKTTRLDHLQRHIESIHDGVKYPCDRCNFKATQLANLNRHKRSIHDGVKYPCDQCNYKATQHGDLKKHKKSVHSED